MYLVVYASSATTLLSNEELDDILAVSRRNNQAVSISGLLLYKGGNFMQLLEGPKDAVLKTLGRIEIDTRHRGIIRLLEREQPEREFAEWSMGFKRADAADAVPIEGFSDFFSRSYIDEIFQKNPSKALQLLLSFKKVVG